MKNFRGPWDIRLFGIRLPRWAYRRVRIEKELRDTTRPSDTSPRCEPTGRARVWFGPVPITPWMRNPPVVIR